MKNKLTYKEWIAQQFRDLEAEIKGMPDAIAAYKRSQDRTEYLNFYGKDEYQAYATGYIFELRGELKFFFKKYDDKYLINNKAVNEPNNR